MSATTFVWQDTSLSPRERAEKLAVESGADMDQLAVQIRVERHVQAIDELGIPRFRITNGPVGVGMGDGTPSPPATSLPMTSASPPGSTPTWPTPTATSSVRRRRPWASTS